MLEFPGPEVFEAVVDRIESGVYVVDGKQRVVYWNHGAEKITGLLTQEMLGRPCASNLGPETLEHNPAMCVHQCPMDRAAREPRHDVMVSMRHRAGHLLRVRLWTMEVRNAVGEIVGAVKVFTDRTSGPEVSLKKGGGLLEEIACRVEAAGASGGGGLPARPNRFPYSTVDQVWADPDQAGSARRIPARARARSGARDRARSQPNAERHDANRRFSGAVGSGKLSGGVAGLQSQPAGAAERADERGGGTGSHFVVGDRALAGELGKLPNKVSIEGHTDAKPFTKVGNYGNWELSADRANAARYNGMAPGQVVQIRGYADQQLGKKDSPEDPSNRRITVIVQYTPKGDAGADAENGSEPPKDAEAPKGGEAAKSAEH